MQILYQFIVISQHVSFLIPYVLYVANLQRKSGLDIHFPDICWLH